MSRRRNLLITRLNKCGQRENDKKLRHESPRAFNRDSPDEPRTVVDFCAFAAFWQDRLAARTIAVILGTPNGDRGADLAILASIWTYSSRQLLLNA
jgi:hypothetical protein